VTAKDISSGKQGSYTKCPIALAAKRHSNGGKIRVGYKFLTLNGQQVQLPPLAQDFVTWFDTGYNYLVHPFKFHVRIEK